MNVSLHDRGYDIQIVINISVVTDYDLVDLPINTFNYYFDTSTGKLSLRSWWYTQDDENTIETPKALVTLFKLKGIL